MIARLFALVVFVLVALVATSARADVSVSSLLDTPEVEVGDTFSYIMTAQSDAELPNDPQLGAHVGLTVVDSSMSPTHMVSIINGRRSEKHGLTVTWTLRADKVGTFGIGPASVAVPGGRKSAPAQRITVVARGKSTRPRSNNPFDPFGSRGGGRQPSPLDPFKGIIPGFDDDDDQLFGRPANADPKFALAEPRGPVAFLHATIDKSRAVVGEQVTLDVYLYEDPHARQGHPSDVHEATATDFVKRPLLQDETRAIGVGNAIVGGRLWTVKLVRKSALFPLKAGRLTIQPMSLTLPQARVGLRESETLTVDVTEPPVAGRPSGYQIGDVGDFSLSATVTPRAITQGGAVGVTVELRGTGNMPAQLPLPVMPGVEWLEPQVKDSLGPMQNDRFGGSRTFSYVVRIQKDGAVDLGEIRLPYFDPTTRTYGVARAGLGIVDVAKGAMRDAGAEVAEPLLPGLPKERRTLEGMRERSFLTERPSTWAIVFGAPLACALAIGAHGLVRRARDRRASAAPSNDAVARDRLREAEGALRGTDGPAAVSAIARSLESAVLAETSVNIRGTASESAVRELVDAGVAADAAHEVAAVLRACEDARFSPDGVSIEEARALWRRVESVLARIRSREGAA